MNPDLFASCYKESVMVQSDHYVDAFIHENVVHGYDDIMTFERL